MGCGARCDVRRELRFEVRCATAGTTAATTIEMANAVMPKRDLVILPPAPALEKAIGLPRTCKAFIGTCERSLRSK
jgi:hypothetical protein